MKLTQNFWKQINNYEIFVSSIVVAEIDKWDNPTRLRLKKLIKNFNILSVDNENIDTILSWNFKHMVRKKVKLGVNYINNLLGYDSIEIMTPAEFS